MKRKTKKKKKKRKRATAPPERASFTQLGALGFAFIPGEEELLLQTAAARPGADYDAPWCPHDLPRDGKFETYWATVAEIARIQRLIDACSNSLHLPALFARLDQWLPLSVAMDVHGVYSDADLSTSGLLVALHPREAVAHTLASMPDLMTAVIHMDLWAAPSSTSADKGTQAWAELITKAMPTPCKGRNLDKSLCDDLDQEPVRDMLMRILFGSLLGIYGPEPRTHAPLEVRRLCYAAFSIQPPSTAQLRDFIRRHKSVVSFCMGAFVLWSIQQLTMHDYLMDNYVWGTVEQFIFGGLERIRRTLGESIATDSNFMRDALRWTALERALDHSVHQNKKYCFRPSRGPFYQQVLTQGLGVLRTSAKTAGRQCGLPIITPPNAMVDRAWSIMHPSDGSGQADFVERVADVAGSGLFKDETVQKFQLARENYYMETLMTGAKHLMVGTDLKPFGLYHTDPEEFHKMLHFVHACNARLQIRWGKVPLEWARAQVEALKRRSGQTHLYPDSGVYFVCLRCCCIRTVPVAWPNGADRGSCERARYADDVRVDIRTMEHFCAGFSLRRRDAIVKRRQRQAVKDGRSPDAHTEGLDIQVCVRTPLLRICMIGVLLHTRRDGLLMLCVDCGTMLAWSSSCLTPRGPSCGCRIPSIEGPKPDLGTCDACGKDITLKSKIRHHAIFDDATGTLGEIRVCQSHKTQWVNRHETVFRKSLVLEAARTQKWVNVIAGKPILLKQHTH